MEKIPENVFQAKNPEVLQDQGKEKKKVDPSYIEKKKIEDGRNILDIRDRIGKIDDSPELSTQEREKIIEEYINKNLPKYLDKNKPSWIFETFRFISKFSLKEVIGKENLPPKEKLFIINHRDNSDARIITASLEKPIHIVSAETINWKGRSKLLRWFLEKIGAVPIQETFSNLSEDQKKQVIEKAPKLEKKAHEKAVKNTGIGSAKNIKTMVSLLLKGEDVAFFSEGPFSRLEEDQRKSYAGYALIAREY